MAAIKEFVEKNDRLPKRKETGGALVNRLRASKAALTATQVADVEAIPHWTWGKYEVIGWDAHVRSLEDFIKVHHTADVRDQDTTEDGLRLRRWVRRVRSFRTVGDKNLTAERISQLDALGFVWSSSTPAEDSENDEDEEMAVAALAQGPQAGPAALPAPARPLAAPQPGPADRLDVLAIAAAQGFGGFAPGFAAPGDGRRQGAGGSPAEAFPFESAMAPVQAPGR